MDSQDRRRLKRFAVSSLIAIAATLLCGVLFGPLAYLIVGCLGFLGVAVAADNNVGSCLLFAVLFLLSLLLVIMALVGTVMIGQI